MYTTGLFMLLFTQGRRSKRAVTADEDKLWPNATVPYKFDSRLAGRSHHRVASRYCALFFDFVFGFLVFPP